MKRFIEKLIAIAISLLFAGLFISIGLFLFGGAVISFFSIIIGFPMAFPMTTGLIVALGLCLFIVKRK